MNEFWLRQIHFDNKERINKLRQKLKEHKQEGLCEEFCNRAGFVPQYKTVHEWNIITNPLQLFLVYQQHTMYNLV